MKLQYTLFCETGKYKPMSTVIEIESMEDYEEKKKQYNRKAIEKILHQRKMNYWNLKQYGYNKYKIREYKTDEEKQQEKETKKAIILKLIENAKNKNFEKE